MSLENSQDPFVLLLSQWPHCVNFFLLLFIISSMLNWLIKDELDLL